MPAGFSTAGTVAVQDGEAENDNNDQQRPARKSQQKVCRVMQAEIVEGDGKNNDSRECEQRSAPAMRSCLLHPLRATAIRLAR